MGSPKRREFRLPFAFPSKVHSTSLQNKQRRPRQSRMVTRWGPRYPTVDLLLSLPKDIDLTRRLDGRRLIVAGSKNSPSSCPSSMPCSSSGPSLARWAAILRRDFLALQGRFARIALRARRQLTASQSPPDTQAIVCQLDFVGPLELQRSFL